VEMYGLWNGARNADEIAVSWLMRLSQKIVYYCIGLESLASSLSLYAVTALMPLTLEDYWSLLEITGVYWRLLIMS